MPHLVGKAVCMCVCMYMYVCMNINVGVCMRGVNVYIQSPVIVTEFRVHLQVT